MVEDEKVGRVDDDIIKVIILSVMDTRAEISKTRLVNYTDNSAQLVLIC